MDCWLQYGYIEVSTPEVLSSNNWIIICGPVHSFFGDDFDLCSKVIALDQRGNLEKKQKVRCYVCLNELCLGHQ